ncbi:hypothetical protein HYPSUDRAFT_52807 [Hypholoma sublateritium FD-334 SS-4]|uniref:DUF4246 domain-containing protein n=1 Tax=Hypholoma sublateritium (strain FD-334 SS-4) TaxID=945553 RepID=A0A0D2PC05_HYPSF|nr:hypothetical protein HYPSUDRAFT_52807 [Hypholoma sublateritium FD-334 SS-4]
MTAQKVEMTVTGSSDEDEEDEEVDGDGYEGPSWRHSTGTTAVVRPEPIDPFSTLPSPPKFSLKEEYGEMGLQVIVRLTNIELTPATRSSAEDPGTLKGKCCERDHTAWLPIIYGCETEGPSVQDVGSVDTREGRFLTFPNTLSKTLAPRWPVGPFKLADSTKTVLDYTVTAVEQGGAHRLVTS